MGDNLRIDGHKLNYHPGRVASWLKEENIYPIYVEIGPSSTCNHRCIFCALEYTGYKAKMIDTKVLCNALTDMANHGVKAVMFSGEGEPTLHKDFPLFVEHAKKQGLDVALTTNGVLFKKEMAEQCLKHLSWIKFSIDAGTKETYAKIHGTRQEDFEAVMTNIKDAVEIKNKNNYPAKIGTQILLIEQNADEVIELARKAKEIGADYLVVKPYSQHPLSSHKFMVDYERFKNLKREAEKMNLDSFKVIFRIETMKKLKEQRAYPRCYGISFYTLIDSEGNVIPCNLHHNRAEYYYGNLYKNTFSEIWNSERRKKIVEELHKQGTANCRENCRLDFVNAYLEALKNPPEHVNFI